MESTFLRVDTDVAALRPQDQMYCSSLKGGLLGLRCLLLQLDLNFRSTQGWLLVQKQKLRLDLLKADSAPQDL
jgi:hypothetical protein